MGNLAGGKKADGAAPGGAPPGSPAYEAAQSGPYYGYYSQPGARSPGPVNFCPYCGEPVGGTFAFCPRCGREMPYVGGPTLFDLVDINHDGVITREELDRALSSVGPLWNASRYVPRVEAADGYHSGPQYSPDVVVRQARPTATYIDPPSYSSYQSTSPSYQLVKKRYSMQGGHPIAVSREVVPQPPNSTSITTSFLPPPPPPLTTSVLGSTAAVPPVTTSYGNPYSSTTYMPPVTSSYTAPGSMSAVPMTGRSMSYVPPVSTTYTSGRSVPPSMTSM
eukprot:CAMPEP_0178383126 /NCGR_PEP_ID=MMETSP0689_2-20121128/6843_1 /TAXON_ID=160604 /ORGANISM="Amphidinium massartii, Strain CS-259" /LENGTH=277 /DNA_ID=CAMNT_0020003341 /DNA_START=56 /DNA_END=886 /DNA_ORIENTATION=-